MWKLLRMVGAPLLEELEENPDVAAVQPKILSWNCKSSFEYAGACGGFWIATVIPFLQVPADFWEDKEPHKISALPSG